MLFLVKNEIFTFFYVLLINCSVFKSLGETITFVNPLDWKNKQGNDVYKREGGGLQLKVGKKYWFIRPQIGGVIL